MKKNELDDIEKKWEENIAEAKTIISSRHYSQMEVARLCYEVCEPTRGGRQVDETVFTIKRFAKEAGIHAKTLSQWMCVYRNVFIKLDSELKVRSNYTACATISKTTTPDASASVVREKVRKYLSNDSLDAKIIRYLGNLRAIAHNFETQDVSNRVKQETLEEVLFYSEMIIHNIKRSFGNSVKPKFHGLTNVYNIREGNSATSMSVYVKDNLGFKIKLSPNDLKILELLKQNKGATPTQLGAGIVSNRAKSPTAKKLAALRSLQKLEGLDLVKSKKGRYIFIKDLEINNESN